MKKTIFILMCCLFFSAVARAQDAGVATQDILQSTIDRSVSILSDTNTSLDQKKGSFDVLLQEVCQPDLMAKLVLGRDGWSALNEEQQKDFIALFIQVLTRSYYNKMDMADVSKVKISYVGNEELSPRKRELKTIVADEQNEYKVNYMFALIDGKWGVYDMVIDGISLLTSYRSQFSDYLQQHSAQELLQMLREKLDGAV